MKGFSSIGVPLVVVLVFASQRVEAQRVRFTVTNLASPGETGSVAWAINSAGDVVGSTRDPTIGRRAFVYKGGTIRYLFPPEIGESEAYGINRLGAIIGWRSGQSLWFFQQNGVTRDVVGASILTGINDSGQVVGSSTTGQALLFTELDGARDLGITGAPQAINNRGDIAGFYSRGSTDRAFLRLAAGQFIDVGQLDGLDTQAHAVNDQGWVVGDAAVRSGASHPFLYKDGQMIDLNPRQQTATSSAHGINSSGQIVGTFTDRETPLAFLYENGSLFNLNDLIPRTSGWVLNTAWAINDAGQIVGHGTYQGLSRAFLLTPTGLAGCDFSISPTSQDFGPRGGSGTIDVATQSGCVWTAQSTASWINIVTYDGSGKGRVKYSVDSTSAGTRAGSITVAGLVFTVNQAPTTYYYGLGDSVASGHGLPDEDGSGCRQSPRAYPRIVGRTLASLNVKDQGSYLITPFVQYLACSGANTTSDLNLNYPAKNLRYQVKAVIDDISALRLKGEAAPAIVSITIGANDFPWSPPLSPAVLQWELPRLLCAGDSVFKKRVGDLSSTVANNVRQRLLELLAVPSTSVILTDYHNPFNIDSNLLRLFTITTQGDCDRNGVSIPSGLYDRSEYAVHELNKALQRVAARAGNRVSFASVHSAFHGHEGARSASRTFGLGCGNALPDFGASWIQYRDLLSIDSYAMNGDCFHPNERGAVEYARAVVAAAQVMLSKKQ